MTSGGSSSDGGSESGGRVTRKKIGLTITALTALAALGGLWIWRTHPTEIPVNGFAGSATREVGDTLYFGLSFPDENYEGDAFTIHAIEAKTASNTADAELRFYLCQLAPELDYGPIGSVDGPEFEKACSDATVVEDGTTLDPGAEPGQQLLLGVTPTTTGVVKVRQLIVTYSRGWQRGTRELESGIVLRARDAKAGS